MSTLQKLEADTLSNSLQQPNNYDTYTIVPARYPMRTMCAIFASILIALVLYSVLTNPKWGWGIFSEWFFSEPVIAGLGRTILLTILGTIFGSILGTLLALARVSKSPVLSGFSWSYI